MFQLIHVTKPLAISSQIVVFVYTIFADDLIVISQKAEVVFLCFKATVSIQETS